MINEVKLTDIQLIKFAFQSIPYKFSVSREAHKEIVVYQCEPITAERLLNGNHIYELNISMR